MAAGSGFKTFATGDVLTAADTNGYLMQGVWVFADAAARTAAVTSPQEGNMSYLKDTNSTEYYSGSAWVAVAGAAGSWTLASTTSMSTTSTSVTIPTGYKQISVWVENYQTNGYIGLRFNSVSTSTYRSVTSCVLGASTARMAGGTGTSGSLGEGENLLTGNNKNMCVITLTDYENTAAWKIAKVDGIEQGTSGYENLLFNNMVSFMSTTAITSLQLVNTSGNNWAGGTIYVYGIK
jgi:hypothetical protein